MYSKQLFISKLLNKTSVKMRFLHSILSTVLCMLIITAHAQDLPITAQTFNNSFYNPASVGVNGNLVDFAFQRRWSGIGGGDENSYSIAYANGHFLIKDYGLAAGVSAYREKVGLFSRTELAASLAYHTQISSFSIISYGLKAAYMQNAINSNLIEVRSQNDQVLNGFNNLNNFDVSFGINYLSEIVDLGVSSNNIMSLLRGFDEENNINYTFPSFFTANARVRSTRNSSSSKSLIEGVLNYRRTTNDISIVDIGAYYSYNRQIILGVNYRNNNALYALAAYNLMLGDAAITIGYSHEIFAGKEIFQNLASNEIFLRYLHDNNFSLSKGNNGPRGRGSSKKGGPGARHGRNPFSFMSKWSGDGNSKKAKGSKFKH